jgi:hypothetical protein
MVVLAALALAGADRPPAPAAHCLDARAMTDMHALDARQLLIRAGEGRYQLTTVGDCPLAGEGGVLLAAHGWVCGGSREFMRSADRLCPVLEVRPIDAREYARLTRQSDEQADATLMQPVESRARRGAAKGFIGTHDYCFKPSQVRSWSATPDAIIVHTSKRRSGGNGAYRVEFSGSCPEAAFNNELVLRSGVGLDLICGNPGDIAEMRRGLGAPFDTGFANASPSLTLETGSNSAAAIGVRGCRIQEVYPIDG